MQGEAGSCYYSLGSTSQQHGIGLPFKKGLTDNTDICLFKNIAEQKMIAIVDTTTLLLLAPSLPKAYRNISSDRSLSPGR